MAKDQGSMVKAMRTHPMAKKMGGMKVPKVKPMKLMQRRGKRGV